MRNKRFYIFILVILGILMIITACSSNQDKTDPNASDGSPTVEGTSKSSYVTLKVTKNYGREIIFNSKVEFKKNWTVYDLLEANIEITTDYGGSFISSINGLESEPRVASGKRLDWFYFINGVCCDVGALDYDLNPGDIVWWDYHTWNSMNSSNSTVIGSYPEPFLHGYRGSVKQTTIMCSSENTNLAATLEQSLKEKGITSIKVNELDCDRIEDRTGPLIIIGNWEELKKIDYINKFNEAYKKNGTYIHFTDRKLELLKETNEIGQIVEEDAGVIMSHGDGLGDDSPLWLIIGVNNNGLKQAIDILVNKPDEILNTYSVAIVSKEVYRLPLK